MNTRISTLAPALLAAFLVSQTGCAANRGDGNPRTPDLPPVEHPPSENGIVAPDSEPGPHAHAEPADAGDSTWTSLFDGQYIVGYVPRGGHAAYLVEDGAIVGETRPGEPNSFLCTERDYGDFVLEFEVLVDDELNSGVQIRSHEDERGVVYGYQVEIEATPRGFSGGIYDEGGRGWLSQPDAALAAHTPFRPGEWNHYRIEAIGPRMRTWINGLPIADLTDDKVASGFIGLQVHGVGDRPDPLRVRWRNLRIRDLD